VLPPGARSAFELTVPRPLRWPETSSRAARPDAELPSPAEKLAIGSALPDFELTIKMAAPCAPPPFAGRWWAIDFIYTRGPLAQCARGLRQILPAATTVFAIGSSRVCCALRDGGCVVRNPAVLRRLRLRLGGPARLAAFLTGDVAKVAALLGEL